MSQSYFVSSVSGYRKAWGARHEAIKDAEKHYKDWHKSDREIETVVYWNGEMIWRNGKEIKITP